MLVIGLVAISLFETVLGILRTYLFSHTTNRIDVELGARLFRHLLALPMAYFQARRVGDSVARVRELENIRNFLTSSALTLVIDLFFTFVFLAVMFFYSPMLTWIVLGSLPLYIAISAAATPLFRRRLDEKFQRGAENQAFLVESVTGDRDAQGHGGRAADAAPLGRAARRLRRRELPGAEPRQHREPGRCSSSARSSPPRILYFGAKLVIDGSLSVGELVAFNMLAGRVSAPVLRLAQMWQDFHQARLSVARLGDILNTAAEPAYMRPDARAAGDPGRHHASTMSRSAIASTGREILHDVSLRHPGRADDRHRRALRLGQEHASPSSSSASMCRKAAACWSTAWISRWSIRPGCAARSASCCRRTCCSTARCATTSRSPIRPCRWSA